MLKLGKRKPTQAELDAAELERWSKIPFPTASVPSSVVNPARQQSYEQLADSLGFVPAELIRARLLAFFESEGIKLYNHNQVSHWLTGKKEQAKATNWCWRPLREKDIITGFSWGKKTDDYGFNDGFYRSDERGCRPYERLVPHHALEKVAKIVAQFGGSVKFFVSDFASPNPDPFIMVRPAMSNSGFLAEYNLIFDAWDEPGFGA